MGLRKHQESENWYAAFMIDGKRYFKSTGTSNKQLARKIEHEMKNQIIAYNKLEGGRHPITLEKAFELYFKSRNVSKGYQKLRSSADRVMGISYVHKGKTVTMFGFDKKKLIHTFTSADIIKLITNRRDEGYSENTIYAHVSVIRGAIKHAEKLGHLTNLQLKFESIKIPAKPITYLKEDQQRRLLAALLPPTGSRPTAYTPHDIAVTILDLGLRIGEVVTLKWSDVDFENGIIHITSHKTQKESHKHISNRLMEVFQRRFKSKKCEWIFANRNHDGHRGQDAGALKRAAKQAGIEGFEQWHQLRRTYASRLIQSGASIFEVSQQLHHTNITTTMRYASLAPNQSSLKAVNILNQLNG